MSRTTYHEVLELIDQETGESRLLLQDNNSYVFPIYLEVGDPLDEDKDYRVIGLTFEQWEQMNEYVQELKKTKGE